jgi:peptide/nickel transport system permease protein
MGLSLPDLFAGALVVESIFAWNGMGLLAINAVQNNDYTLIMGITVMFAMLTILGNLLADIGYALLDPRIRYD